MIKQARTHDFGQDGASNNSDLYIFQNFLSSKKNDFVYIFI